jgi:hypothetical protein
MRLLLEFRSAWVGLGKAFHHPLRIAGCYYERKRCAKKNSRVVAFAAAIGTSTLA